MRTIFNKSNPGLNFIIKTSSKQDGLTLIEVLVSLVLLGLVLTTFFSFFSQSMLFSAKNEENLVANNLTTQTLKIIEIKYKDTLIQTELKINCDNYPNGYPQELKDAFGTSACFYKKNQKKYYPEIILTKQTTLKFPIVGLPPLYVVHVKMYSSTNPSDRRLLSETFGYIRGK